MKYDYDIFICYSHQDRAIAATIQSALTRWTMRPRIRVFRDESLAPQASLPQALEARLRGSRYLLLVASPACAESNWVAKELCYWLNVAEINRVILVLVDGTFSASTEDIDWAATDCLPSQLRSHYLQVPLVCDLRSWRNETSEAAKRRILKERCDKIAETVLNKPPGFIRAKERAVMLRWLGALASLAVASLSLAGVSRWQYLAAEENRVQARALQLGAKSRQLAVDTPALADTALLLGAESIMRRPTSDGVTAVATGLALRPAAAQEIPTDGPIRKIYPLAGGTHAGYPASGKSFQVVALETGQGLASLQADMLAVSQNGKRIAVSSTQGSIRVFDIEGAIKDVLTIAGPCRAMALAPDGGKLAVLVGEEFKVYALPTGQLTARGSVDESLAEVTFSPDGNVVVASGALASRAMVIELLSAERPARSVSVEDGIRQASLINQEHLVVVTGSGITIHDTVSGKALKNWAVDGGSTGAFALSEDGQLAAVAGVGGSRVQVLRLPEMIETQSIETSELVASLQFSADGARLLIASGLSVLGGPNSTATVWDLRDRQEKARVGGILFGDSATFLNRKGTEVIAGLGRFPEGSAKVTTGSPSEGHRLGVWRIGGDSRWQLHMPGGILHAALSSSRQYLAVASEAAVSVHDIASGNTVFSRSSSDVGALAVSSLGAYVLVSDSRSGGVSLLSRNSERPTLFVDKAGSFPPLVFHPNGRAAVVGREDGSIAVIEVSSRDIKKVDLGEEVKSLSFDAQGSILAAAGSTRFALWAFPSLRALSSPHALKDVGIITSLALSPDGSHVAIAGDSAVGVFKVPNLAKVSLVHVGGKTNRIEWAGQGDYVLGTHDAGVTKKRVSVLSATGGTEVLAAGTYQEVLLASLLSDGSLVILTPSGAKVLDWRPERIVDLVCSRVGRRLSNAEWSIYVSGAYEPLACGK